MQMRKFIREHRETIDRVIRSKLPDGNRYRLNDRERELWVANDWDLYQFAIGKGVRFE